MALSDEMRRLDKKWAANSGWPKRLEWMEVAGLRGWTGQRIDLQFPIIAVVGENGSGKSTLLQAAACVYRGGGKQGTRFPSEFFPDTAWDAVRGVNIKFGYMEGKEHHEHSIRKPTSRWLGHAERPTRDVKYVDLSRIQPVSARVGFAKIAKNKHTEASATPFGAQQVERLSRIMGRSYDGARMAVSSIAANREIPIITKKPSSFSGFHQGSGETVVMELLRVDLPKYGLVLIDEIESSLHPRSQRRLMRDLADLCRTREVQIMLTTHSPFVLEELPLASRIYILEASSEKTLVHGISPNFAMTKMDDESHPECDVFVEDFAATIMLSELLARHAREIFVRCRIVPYGAVNVGHAIGQMAKAKRFPRPSCVFLDGDSAEADGCVVLPGGDAPERVVFNALKDNRFGNLWSRLSRDISWVIDACSSAMTLGDHHEWIRVAANKLMCGGDVLWQAMCAEWAGTLDADEVRRRIVQPIEDALA